MSQAMPAGQTVQDVCPPVEYVPVEHCVTTAWDVDGQAKPLGQTVQEVALPMEYVPFLHRLATAMFVVGQE